MVQGAALAYWQVRAAAIGAGSGDGRAIFLCAVRAARDGRGTQCQYVGSYILYLNHSKGGPGIKEAELPELHPTNTAEGEAKRRTEGEGEGSTTKECEKLEPRISVRNLLKDWIFGPAARAGPARAQAPAGGCS